jgi:hypothetical protein
MNSITRALIVILKSNKVMRSKISWRVINQSSTSNMTTQLIQTYPIKPRLEINHLETETIDEVPGEMKQVMQIFSRRLWLHHSNTMRLELIWNEV